MPTVLAVLQSSEGCVGAHIAWSYPSGCLGETMRDRASSVRALKFKTTCLRRSAILSSFSSPPRGLHSEFSIFHFYFSSYFRASSNASKTNNFKVLKVLI
ncbi:hypothetical protein FQA47_023513 [Oryzias melastigma]|uniref:Uncharacterized protein n=1 Tax=Oryzias melastigma TaxID=30732 RepID=A0A834KZX3_ORYME|nr:hypothetical protein FQA47_023513 [Oryzias melastigma]